MRKRLLVGVAASATVLWLASAALYWWAVGASTADLAPGLAVAPTLLAQQARELLAPEAPFAGLQDSAALAQLRLAFGQGVRPADGRLLHDLIVSRGCRRVLDVGTAVWFGLAVRRTGGDVVTIEPAGGLVVAHNAFGFRLSEPEFRTAIHDDPRFETTIVPTLSGGLSITTKK